MATATTQDTSAVTPGIKVVVVGDGNVGKTCLCYTYQRGTFPKDEYKATIFENANIDVRVRDTDYRVSLWDTGGQEEYEQLRTLMYPGTDVFLLCYAVDSVPSFDNVVAKWAPELRHHCPRCKIVLVGTKTDCRDEPEPAAAATTGERPRSVDTAHGKKVAKKKLKADGFVESSARTGRGVREAFELAVQIATFGPPKRRRKLCGVF